MKSSGLILFLEKDIEIPKAKKKKVGDKTLLKQLEKENEKILKMSENDREKVFKSNILAVT